MNAQSEIRALRQVAPGAHAVLSLRRCRLATWQGKRLRTPHNITLLRLPSYSPRTQPDGKRFWGLSPRQQAQLGHVLGASYEAIVAAWEDAWQFRIADRERIDSIARRSSTWVNL